MIDKKSGQVSYAVLTFAGFLGIGDEHYPLPWQSLKYDTGLGGYSKSAIQSTRSGRARKNSGSKTVALQAAIWSSGFRLKRR